MTSTQVYLYEAGFIQTQVGYYETPLNKNVIAICDDEVNVSYYNTTGGELVEVATSVVGDANNTYSFTNGLD